MDILFGVPQGSILGPLLLNIFLCDIFLFQNNTGFISYPDDSTLYYLGESAKDVITKLEESSRTNFKWFKKNGMKAYPDKCHLLVNKKGSFVANIVENKISDTKPENFLGITFDKRLTSNNHVSNLCKAACNKLNGIARVISYMDKNKKRILFNSYFSLSFYRNESW